MKKSRAAMHRLLRVKHFDADDDNGDDSDDDDDDGEGCACGTIA